MGRSGVIMIDQASCRVRARGVQGSWLWPVEHCPFNHIEVDTVRCRVGCAAHERRNLRVQVKLFSELVCVRVRYRPLYLTVHCTAEKAIVW